MLCSLQLFLVLIACLGQETELAIPMRKFVYQKDMSEYCRRRVVPSVFVGRHVVEANSQILHFSRMELPYSCFIAVRTESGSNLIVVIQLASDESLMRSCSESGNQLLVYEMGETFGGYWGPLPDTVMKPEPFRRTKFYTLKTTESTTEMSTEEENDSAEETVENSSSSVSKQAPVTESNEYIRMEVPIVNVSGELLPGKGSPEIAFDVDETFDFIYDVTPRSGSKYETSILPLVQFSIRKQTDGRGDDGSALYELDVADMFTPDTRLTLPQLSRSTFRRNKINKKYRLTSIRRHNIKKSRILYNAKASSYSKKLTTKHWLPLRSVTRPSVKNYIPLRQHLTTKNIGLPYIFNKKYIQDNRTSWKLLDDLIMKLNKTTELNVTEESTESDNITSKLQTISNDITQNAYLTSNLSPRNELIRKSHLITLARRYVFNASPQTLTSISYRTYKKYTKPTDNISVTFRTKQDYDPLLTNEIKTESVTVDFVTNTTEYHYVYNTSTDNKTYHLDNNNNYIVENITTEPEDLDIRFYLKTETDTETKVSHTSNTEKSLRGSMVDHESWENVVQAAPVMAVLLNKTVTFNKENINDGDSPFINFNATYNKSYVQRKKRYIHSISIENAKPHNVTVTRETGTTPKLTYRIADMQDFAQLVELQDDEMHGRVALRYLRQYVGPALFNICDNHVNSERHIFLFNSSRIVLAITNFTMDRMSVVLTPARTLLSGDARCATKFLECQVSGARVCVDSLTACDGVPNCGSYDIYDEDRLKCGGAMGLQHNVCIAAFAFLAVLLTMLYTVHYWLKRCVPKVAEAFFIYTDGVENVLYLDSIMRSPTDIDDDMKMIYNGNIFDDYTIYGGGQMKEKKRWVGEYLKKIFLINIICRKNKMKEIQEEVIEEEFSSTRMEPKKIFSFTELQIRKMIGKQFAEASVQTGDSLEMTLLENIKEKEKVVKSNRKESPPKPEQSEYETPMMISDSLLTLVEPLSEQKHIDELSLLKFFRSTRSESIQSTGKSLMTRKRDIKSDITADEEMEIKSHDYELRGQMQSPKSTRLTTTTKCDVHKEKANPSGCIRKRLRFEEDATTIPWTDYDQEAVIEGNDNLSHRQSVVLGVGKKRGTQDLDTIEECDEQSSSRNHRRFWGSSRGKKSKKKTHVPLR